MLVDVLIRPGDIRDGIVKLSEISPNFARFLSSQILGVQFPQKLYLKKKFMRLRRHHSPKVIMANMLNFKPIFECSLLKIVGGPPSTWGCASKFWSFPNACKNLRGQLPQGAEMRSFEKVDLGPNWHVQLCC